MLWSGDWWSYGDLKVVEVMFVVYGWRFVGSGEGMVIGLGCGGGILVDCGENLDK